MDVDVDVDAPPEKVRRVKTIGHTLDPELRAILERFDLDGNGIELKEVEAASRQWAESQGDRGCFSLMAFPQALREELQAFDLNKDGSVDKAELAAAAHMYQQTKHQAKRMRVVIAVMTFVIILLMAGTFLLSYIAADLAKEMRASDQGKITTPDGYVAATAEATEVAQLVDFPSLTIDVLKTAKDITVLHNGAAHYYVVGSIVKTPSELTNATSEDGEWEEFGDVHIRATSGQTISILVNGSLIVEGEQVDLSASSRRLSAIEAQNSGTLAMQSSSGPCKRWCIAKDKSWAEKCAEPWLKNCRGCMECSQDPFPAGGGCAHTCQSDTLKWTKKCKWYECTGCSECGGGGSEEEDEKESEDDTSWVGKPCKRWCLEKEKTWQEKCQNTKNCEGCAECHQDSYPASPGCAAVCAPDPLKWSVKCISLWECSQCPQCTEGYNPSAHVPPPALPIPTFVGDLSAPAHVNFTLKLPEGPASSEEVSFLTGRACRVTLELPPAFSAASAVPHFSFDGAVPAGLGINLRSGTITWQPDATQLGSHNISIVIDTATDSHRLNLTLMVSFGANNPPGIYVWPAGGSDFNDGTLETPFETVSYAALMAEPGDTIYIRGGSYIVQEDIEFEGDSENRLLITRLPGERVRLIAKRKRHVFHVLSNTVGVTFRGVEVDGAARNDHWAVLSRSWWRVNDEVLGGWNGFKIEGQHINVENCVIHDFNQKGIEIGEGRYVALHYNLIYNIGLSSLSGGGGIHRKWTVNFGTDDDLERYRWDIFGNAVWSVEQRIYSFIPWKGYCLMEIDEGKPISVDSTRDKNMKARIAHNLVLYGGVDHIRLLVNPNIEVYNNMVMGELGRTQPTPDGITVKGDSGKAIKCSGDCIFGGYIEGLKLFNNVVHTGPGSIAFGMTDQFEESDNPGCINHNYFSGGGRSQPEYMPGLSSLPTEQSPSVFRTLGSEDYHLSDVIPEGVGVNQSIIEHLLGIASDYGVEIAPSGWRHDHCRMVQTIVGSYPTEHLKAPELGTSKFKKDHVAYKFEVHSQFYKKLCKCKVVELIFPEWLAEQCLHS